MGRRGRLARSAASIVFLLVLASPALRAANVSAPTLSATAASSSRINLSWSDPNRNETGYQVERSLSSTSGFALITTTGANVISFANTGLAASTRYYYRVRAVSNSGTSAYSNTANALTSAAATGGAPAAPSYLTASGVSSITINLAWRDNSTNETAFLVERASGSAGPWAQIGTTAQAAYGDSGRPASTTYWYRVRASNSYGVSAYSNTASGTTLAAAIAPGVPAAPSGLSATTVSASQINLAWADTSSNESGFKIERSTSTTPWTQIATVAVNVRSYSSVGLAGSTTYLYRVRAYNTSGDSAYSNSASAATSGTGGGGSGAHIWSTHFGGSAATDYAKTVGMVVDGTGASIVLGTMAGNVNFGGGTLTSAGGDDIYLVKYSSSGGFQWAKRFGGTQSEVPKGIAVDTAGNVVITGFFRGSASFGGTTLAGTSASGFVAKYSSSGAHLWSKRLTSSTGMDEGIAVAVDSAGSVIVGAGFYTTAIFGSVSLTSAGSEDIALVKYDSSGNQLWAKRFGGASNDLVTSVAVDATTGEVVVAGYFAGSVNFGGTTLTSAGYNDAFVARYTSAGAHSWSKRWGSTSEDKAYGVDVDNLGNVAVTGSFTNNVDFGGGPITNVGGTTSADIFLVKLSNAGIYLWSKGFGSGGVGQIGKGVAFDGVGNVLLTGSLVALSSSYTVDLGGGPLTGNGYYNPLIAKYSSSGAHIWSKRYIAGTADGFGWSVGADASNNVIAAGYYQGSINLGGLTLPSPGGEDTHLVKLGP